jgi:formylglycine-generating enzyme
VRFALASCGFTIACTFSALTAAWWCEACARDGSGLPPQVVFAVDTDAPITGGYVPPLFSQIEFAVYPPGKSEPCAACVRSFSVSDAAFRNSRVSIGIPSLAPTLQRDAFTRVRVRLFRASGAVARSRSTLERLVLLPAVAADASAHIVLSVDMLDAASTELNQPIVATAGPPPASRVGTWAASVRAACTGIAPSSSVCIPGGAFWMGAAGAADDDERLVVLSPFFLDAHEVTAATYLGYGGAFDTPERAAPNTARTDYCTASAGPSDLPMNCVRRSGAIAYCSARGGRLPTEAEFEYVAGNLRAQAFPWGPESPSCSDGVFSRVERLNGPLACTGENALQFPPGPAAIVRTRLGERDYVQLASGSIFDLAGNLSEFVSDAYQARSSAFWSSRKVFRDPETRAAELGASISTRGGSYAYPRSAQDSRSERDEALFTVGFRCAYDAR